MTENLGNTVPMLQQKILQIFADLRKQSIASITIEEYRATFDAFSALTSQPNDVTIETDDINGLPAEWIVPGKHDPKKVILYFHSGTYINGSLKTDRALASMLANMTHTKILQVAYRLAPEHLFPTPIYDGLAAYHWLTDHGYTPRHIALAGSAAGGGITLAVLQLLRDYGSQLPVVAACLSPWIDLTLADRTETKQKSKDFILNPTLLEYAASHYIRPEEASLPLASPLYADLHGLPPMLLQVGQYEILHDDTYQFEQRAVNQGVRAHGITWEHMFHGWHAFANVLQEGHLALDQIAAYFEKYL